MTGNNLLINVDPQELDKQVKKFIKDKKEVKLYYNTTPLVVGVDKLGNGQIQVYITVLIQWECTNEEWQSFLFAHKTLIK